jgi:hypothetical protein
VEEEPQHLQLDQVQKDLIQYFQQLPQQGVALEQLGLFHQVFQEEEVDQEVQEEEVEEVELIKHQDQVEQEIPLQ